MSKGILGRVPNLMADLIKLVRRSHEFWIFMAFLVVSILFWCAQTLKESTTFDVEYKLSIDNIPNSVILTSEIPSTVTVSLSGKGFSILGQLMRNKRRIVHIDFLSLPQVNECVNIDLNTWRKVLAKVLPNEVTVVNVNPSPLELYISKGKHKQLPVICATKVATAKDHVLLGVNLNPQYVNVYAPDVIFDTLTSVYTEGRIFNNVEDTLDVSVALQKIKGVKFVPDSVSIQLCVDLLATRTMQVPIITENVPSGKIVRTFPTMAEITFSVSTALYNTIKSSDFVVAVDYQSLSSLDAKCKVILRKKPQVVSSVEINPKQVEYLIEQ